LVFDEWVTSDGSQTAPSLAGQTVTFSRGGTTTQVGLQSLNDNLARTAGAMTSNDGFLLFSGYAVTAGDTVTIKAGSWSFSGAALFNPQTVQTFTGNVFLANALGSALSSPISAGPVPEPGQYAQVAGVGVLGWALLRRFRRNQANRVG
jgi:hypothetical protein